MVTPVSSPAQAFVSAGTKGSVGERLTRDEAFDLLRRAVGSLVENDRSVSASAVRDRARDLLGRDSESLNERNFIRILKDAHDADVIDLRRRGDDFEVARAEAAPSVSEQLAKAQPAASPKPSDASPARLSLRGRGSGPRGRLPLALPPELLALGVVQAAPVLPQASDNGGGEVEAPRKRPARKRGGKAVPAAVEEAASPRGAKRPRRPRAKKTSRSDDA